MHIIRDSAAMSTTLDSLTEDHPVKRLLRQRVNELTDYGQDIGELACFVIIEPGDTLLAVEAKLNLSIAPDPSWEWIQGHGDLWEAPFILTDDGYGHVLLIPDREGIDPVLRNLCRAYVDEADRSHSS